MATTFDHLVTKDIQSDLLLTHDISISSLKSSSEESILDLSQRSTITTTSTEQFHLIDNWRKDLTCNYTDNIDEDLNRILLINETNQLNIEQSLTDQLNKNVQKEYFTSDNQSQIDFYCSTKKSTSSSSDITIHELIPCLNSSPYSSSNFIWSKYLSLIDERSVSDEFFDHYLASIESGFKIDMKIEYCYDIENDLYWLTQIQLVSYYLIRLHYVGLEENDTSNDFWINIYDQRCHPIGWCKQHNKIMTPPSSLILNKSIASLNDDDIHQTPADYLFNKEIGLTPVEQLKVGMLLEIQDLNRPWTLWFVRIINNSGGRLHLRYVINEEEEEDSSLSLYDIHIFYLDRRIHFIGWTSNNSSIYSYDLPICLKINFNKQIIIDKCLNESLKQFNPPNLFKEQEEIIKHRFIQGMKLEIFQSKTQNIYIGKIGLIHNEYYFDVIIDNDDENQYSFVAHSTHPHILPPHWAAEHKLSLMNGKNIRQSDDYWNCYTEKNGLSDLAPEKCFNIITLNTTGPNKVESGMKMEMISTLNNKDYVFSVTLIHVADHLMWLRIDNTNLFNDNEQLYYHVLPINSLDVFPVGWAKFNGFDLITPIEYQMETKTYQINRYNLFSSVTHYPQIPRVYLNEIYQLTIYVNIRCFCGPHLCTSRLARIPSQFGPGPYRHVLIDMFHHLLSATSTSAHRALRRLDHQINSEKSSIFKTESIKAAKKSSKLIRPISIPNEPHCVYQYLRLICTQLEACPNLFSIKHIDQSCPDKCHILSNTFVFSTHSKNKRTQLRAAQNRYRKQKSLLCHLKNPATPTNVPSPIVEELPLIEIPTPINNINEVTQSVPISLPGSGRQTRGFRVYIEPKTHTVTRTKRKQKIVNIKQEPIERKPETLPVSTTNLPIKETKRSRISNKKRSLSPVIYSSSPITLNILSTNQNKKKRRPISISQSYNDFNSSSNITQPKKEAQTPPPPSSPSSLIRSMQYTIAPPIDPRNPITWNVNDVCWYLNEVGCSFALKTIKEQEIDGAALLLLDDLDTVQNLLEFKLGPAVKLFHVVEQLRNQVIDTLKSSPSLKTSSRLSNK